MSVLPWSRRSFGLLGPENRSSSETKQRECSGPRNIQGPFFRCHQRQHQIAVTTTAVTQRRDCAGCHYVIQCIVTRTITFLPKCLYAVPEVTIPAGCQDHCSLGQRRSALSPAESSQVHHTVAGVPTSIPPLLPLSGQPTADVERDVLSYKRSVGLQTCIYMCIQIHTIQSLIDI